MCKRLATVLMTLLTVLLLTGCSADKKAVTEAAEGFLNGMVANDKEVVSQYVSEEFMKSETMQLMDPDYLADAFYAAMNVKKEDMNEETQKAVDAYVGEVVERAYQSFKIQDIKVQDTTAAVTVNITLGYDPDASAQIPEETIDLISQYQSDHYDELVSIYTDEGENAMYRKLYNDLIPIVVGKMQEALAADTTTEEKTILTLEKVDGKWLITNLEENRPDAAAGSTEEAATAATTSTEYAAETEFAAEGSTSSEYAEEAATDGEYSE